MRYGTLFIAYVTGGLKDIIIVYNVFGDVDKVLVGMVDYNQGEGVGMGWLFKDMNVDVLMWVVRSACDVYRFESKMW